MPGSVPRRLLLILGSIPFAIVGSTPALAGDPPGPPRPAAAAEPMVAPTEVRPPAADTGAQVVVHFQNSRPDDERGPVKLARLAGQDVAHGGNVTIVTTKYEELCSEPCGATIDISERPILFFVRDGQAVSYGFRIPVEAQEVTLKVRPTRKGLLVAGFSLLYLVLPAAIPMIVAGRPKVQIADGPPAEEQDFIRLRKAKT